MGEGLELHARRHTLLERRELCQGHLTRGHDAARAQAVPDLGGLTVAHAGLCAHVQLHLRGVHTGKARGAEVAHDEGVDAGSGRLLQEGGQLAAVLLVHEHVAGQVHGNTRRMGLGADARQLDQGEVAGARPHAKALRRQVDGIGPVAYGVVQLFFSACRRQQLHRLSLPAPMQWERFQP